MVCGSSAQMRDFHRQPSHDVRAAKCADKNINNNLLRLPFPFFIQVPRALHPYKFVTVLLAQSLVDGLYRMKEHHPKVAAISLDAEDRTAEILPRPVIERPNRRIGGLITVDRGNLEAEPLKMASSRPAQKIELVFKRKILEAC